MCIRVFLSLYVFLMAPTLGFAWQSKADNKPVDELTLMDEFALGNEASDACIASASGRPAAVKVVAMQYIQTIGRVATQKIGSEPDWVTTMVLAISADNGQMCIQAFSDMNARVRRKGMGK